MVAHTETGGRSTSFEEQKSKQLPVGSPLILSIDVGTQSIRAMVFDRQGRLQYMQRALVPPYETPHPGWAELPASAIWETFCSVTRKLANEMGERMADLQACGLTANRNNLIALDAEGNPLRNWILWMDQRRAPEAIREAETKWKGLDRLIYWVQKPLLQIALGRSQFNWLRFHEPRTWNRAHKYLTMGGMITYQLTGQYHDSYGMQAGVIPFEVKKMDFYRLPLIYRAVGVSRHQLADQLFHPGESMGTVTASAAEQTGLPEGLPIVAVGGDKQTETLGAGAFSAKTAVLSYGTMASVTLNTETCIRDRKFTFYTFPASRKNYFCEEFVVDRGYWLVTWFCRQYAQEESHPSFLEAMNQQASEIAPGSEGLFVYPFWSPHPVLFPEARGMVLGWTDDHHPAHLYRAILESVAYSLRFGLEALQKKTKQKVEQVRVVGGGSRSDMAMQLTADILNLPVLRMETDEVGGIGAAIPTAVYAGFYADEEEAAEVMCRVRQVFYPQPAAVAVYDRLYRNVFLKLYRSALPFFRELAQLRKESAEEG